LRDVFARHLDQETSEYFSSVHAGVRRLERTVDLILNISRIQSGDTRLNPVMIDLTEFLRLRVEDFRRIIAAKGVELRFEVESEIPLLLLDEYCMAQAIDNLLDNANKFTQNGWIAVRLHRPSTGQVVIDVEDTGIGISDAYLPHLFERYSQEDVGYSRKYEGIGLGLTLVKEYLRLNGGSISVRSVKGQGTTFTLQLPVSSAPAA
jgi:signal transduction histidine kinase